MVATLAIPRVSHRRSASLLRALLVDLVLRRELLPDGKSWLDDVDAERWVLRHMWEGCRPPDDLSPIDFEYTFHKWLFRYVKDLEIDPGQEGKEFLNLDRMVTLCIMHRHGEDIALSLKTEQDRRYMLGSDRWECLEAIANVTEKAQWMKFEAACQRVRTLAIRRRCHHRAQRLLVLLEQATVDPKELWREHRGIGELLTSLTGTDGTVDGW